MAHLAFNHFNLLLYTAFSNKSWKFCSLPLIFFNYNALILEKGKQVKHVGEKLTEGSKEKYDKVETTQ